jgi:hypothetical protein
MATAPEPEKKLSWYQANLEKAREGARKWYEEKKKDPAFVQSMRDKANERYRKKMKDIDFRYQIRQYNRDYARINRTKIGRAWKECGIGPKKKVTKNTETQPIVRECVVKDVQENVIMDFGGGFRIGR